MNDEKKLSREELRKLGFDEGKALTIHLIQDCITQKRNLYREQIDCECVDTRCSMHMDPESLFETLEDDSDTLALVAASDSGIDAVLDAVFVGKEELKDLELATMRLEGFENFRKDRSSALVFTKRLVEKCKGEGIYLPLSVKGALHWVPDQADPEEIKRIDDQIDTYIIPMLQKEIDALGD